MGLKAHLRDMISVDIEYGKYPGGEIYLKTDLKEISQFVLQVEALIKSSDDIMALLLLTDALRNFGTDISKTMLRIPYFPYARQDRKDLLKGPANASLSVKIMADLINNLGYESVAIIEPHSDVTPALVDRCFPIGIQHFFKKDDEEYVLICPDQGAMKRCQEFATHHNISEIVMCEKKRDMVTGKILGTVVHDIDKLKQDGKIGLIVDDICDGGRTFIEIAKKVREMGGTVPLHLLVAHGIFSQGKEVLYEHFEEIYAVNDFTE